MKNIPKLLLSLVVVIVLIVFIFFMTNLPKEDSTDENSESSSSSATSAEVSEFEYLLDDYPVNDVPLYKVTEVSSSKLYNNWDSRNISTFDDKDFSYHNVVFYTEASQSEFLDYYKSIFDQEIVEEFPIPDMVKGLIGKYRVTAAHYDSDETAYVQVYFPNDEFTKENNYFDTFPSLFIEDTMFVEEENSYGLLNQVGGQTEYTKYFTVLDSGDENKDGIDDIDEFGILIEKYKGVYENKEDYQYNSESGLMSWIEDGYQVKASFSRDHGRIYLNIRGSISK